MHLARRGMGEGAVRSSGDWQQRTALRPLVERACRSLAGRLGTFSDHRVSGVGGGTYWQEWVAELARLLPIDERRIASIGNPGRARDHRARAAAPRSHTAGVGAVRARPSPLVPFAFAAFVGWVVHSGVDWDWELMGVSGAALICGVGLIAAGRGDARASRPWRERPHSPSPWSLRCWRRPVCSRAPGSTALRQRFERGDLAGAVQDARSSRRFAPWSIEPLELIAAARADQGSGRRRGRSTVK